MKKTLFLVSLIFSQIAFAEPTALPVDQRIQNILQTDLNKLPVVQNIYELHKMKLEQGSAKVQPWSGSYWPFTEGSFANPYKVQRDNLFDPSSGESISFGYDFDSGVELFHFRKKHHLNHVRYMREEDLNNLSPTEKYDLMMGDFDFKMTQLTWDNLIAHKNKWGEIKSWEGSCNGWSTAAIRAPRPKHSVTVNTVIGKKLTFYPTDLKALATLLYANSLFQDYVRIDGQFCNRRKPAVDRKTGRMILESCEGTDPAVWHTAMTNVMGIRKESFIMNRNNRAEIWNQPIAKYEMSYFNPISGNSASFENAIVSRAAYGTEDPFLDWRSKEGVKLIGVEMKVTYTKEPSLDESSTDENNTPGDDILTTKTFLYDLELDANGKIVGGEWRARADGIRGFLAPRYAKFPGFIWTLPAGEAISVGDTLDQEGNLMNTPEYTWNGSGAVPATWVSGANKSREFMYAIWKKGPDGRFLTDANGYYIVDYKISQPQPLAKAVKTLLEMSQ